MVSLCSHKSAAEFGISVQPELFKLYTHFTEIFAPKPEFRQTPVYTYSQNREGFTEKTQHLKTHP